MDAPGHERLVFHDRGVLASFEFRVVTVPPGASRVYQESDWEDAIVLVEHGRIELECLDGSRQEFGEGDVLCLVGLSLRTLHNRDEEPVRLMAVSRKRAGY